MFVYQDIKFCEDILKHANTGSRLDEVAVVCALDMCRAASRIHNDGEYTLRVIANDIAHEIKVRVYLALDDPCVVDATPRARCGIPSNANRSGRPMTK